MEDQEVRNTEMLEPSTKMNTSETDIPEASRLALEWFKNDFVRAFNNGEVTTKALSKIAEDNQDFFINFFTLLDSDENGSVCLQEFAGGLHKLGLGRDIPNRQVSELTQVFLQRAGPSGELELEQFTAMCRESKFTARLFDLFDIDESGKVDVTEFMIGLDKLARSSTDMKWFAWAEKWFSNNASNEGHITKQQFLNYLNVSKSFFAERLFEVVDSDGSGTVDVTELMQTMHVLTYGSPKERLLMLFSVYDIDGNGSLNRKEIVTVLQWCLSDSSLQDKGEILGKLTNVLFENMDRDNSGDISLPEFEHFLNKYPKIAENLTISFSKCIRPKKKNTISFAKLRRNVNRTISEMRNNKSMIGYWLLYTAVNVTLFMTAAAKYWPTHNIYVVLARGPGQCLNLNSAFIVVLMYRNILTYIRSTRLRKYLPLDHSIKAHKVTGMVITVFSLLHTAMHVVNFENLSHQTNVTWVEYMFTLQDGLGWVGGSACITGWILVVVLAMIVITSSPWCRRHGYFQLFYWTHWLFIGWWIVLIIHAPNFWKWVIGPAVVYVLEKLWRHVKSKERSYTVIKSIRSVDSKISEVIIKRPRRFKFNAGDYVFIQIQDIATFEWHPFTISSPPEKTDIISLHIQAVGDWTKRLRAVGELWTPRTSVVSVDTTESTIVKEPCHDNIAFVNEDINIELPSPLPANPHVLGLDRQSTLENPQKFFQTALSKPHLSRQNALQSPGLNRESTIEFPGFKLQNAVALPDGNPNQVSLLLMRPKVPNEYLMKANMDLESSDSSDNTATRQVKVILDGPYGTPSTHVYSADHAVLIAAGIGVTPFASILQSMTYRRKRQRAICPQCNFWWKIPEADSVSQVPRKVDFIWVTRTFATLEWFLDVLGELEEEEALLSENERFLNLKLHVTSALAQSDIRAVALQMALELCYQKEARDPLCGLRTRIQPGRPNWNKVFQNIRTQKTGKVCVFYCGPPQLEKTLKKICMENKLDFRSENF